MSIFAEKLQVFQGYHSNPETYRLQTWYVNRARTALHLMSLHHSAICISLGSMDESLIFRRFQAENR